MRVLDDQGVVPAHGESFPEVARRRGRSEVNREPRRSVDARRPATETLARTDLDRPIGGAGGEDRPIRGAIPGSRSIVQSLTTTSDLRQAHGSLNFGRSPAGPARSSQGRIRPVADVVHGQGGDQRRQGDDGGGLAVGRIDLPEPVGAVGEVAEQGAGPLGEAARSSGRRRPSARARAGGSGPRPGPRGVGRGDLGVAEVLEDRPEHPVEVRRERPGSPGSEAPIVVVEASRPARRRPRRGRRR